jgi:hypothetical protein
MGASFNSFVINNPKLFRKIIENKMELKKRERLLIAKDVLVDLRNEYIELGDHESANEILLSIQKINKEVYYK